MAHAKPEHLSGLEVLLAEIRKVSALKEKSFGCFYHKSKGVLHFHVKGDRLYAHVFDGEEWNEVDLKPTAIPAVQISDSKKILKLLPVKAAK